MLPMMCMRRTPLIHVTIFEPNHGWLTVMVVAERGEGR